MHLFLQNGHVCTLEWPFQSIKNNLLAIYLSKMVFLGSKYWKLRLQFQNGHFKECMVLQIVGNSTLFYQSFDTHNSPRSVFIWESKFTIKFENVGKIWVKSLFVKLDEMRNLYQGSLLQVYSLQTRGNLKQSRHEGCDCFKLMETGDYQGSPYVQSYHGEKLNTYRTLWVIGLPR